MPPPRAEGLRGRVAVLEKAIVEDALAAHRGNQSAAARALGVTRVTLIDKMKRHGIDRPVERQLDGRAARGEQR